jgi:hypothetical protein
MYEAGEIHSQGGRNRRKIFIASQIRGQPVRGLTMPAMYHTGASTVWADALFVSVLQRSDKPSVIQVRQAIATAVRVHGGPGCAQRVAQEFGDHPETAVARMRWARAVADAVFTSPPVPAQASARRRPGLLPNGSAALELVGK